MRLTTGELSLERAIALGNLAVFAGSREETSLAEKYTTESELIYQQLGY
ncbi:MAG: hypothetical protein HC799_13955 [Limnothrix sp. RL_2_0]|nr:hypothetical protein [Limnothrix sp. RL_2_0]